jgi:hypothetical protein
VAKILCYQCARPIDKDVIALNRKLIGRSTKRFLCLACLAVFFGCTEDDLRQRIEWFREQGCALFA